MPVVTSFAEPKRQLGYRRLRLLEACPLGAAGTTFRGHEFHYASLAESGPAPALFEVTDARRRALGEMGLRAGTVAGSFLHLIDRTTEPGDSFKDPSHLRLVDS